MIKYGKGWRLGWKSSPLVYKGLIGADDWAIELTQAEMKDFIRLILQIDQAIIDIHQHLMDEETIEIEVESELIWLGAKGYPDNYSLRIILSQQRGCEGTWSENAIKSLINATQSLDFDSATF